MRMYWTEHSWGPWNKFPEDMKLRRNGEKFSMYHPQLAPKWISDKGREMWLVYTSRNSFGFTGDKFAYPRFK